MKSLCYLKLFAEFAGKVNNITIDKCTKMGILFTVSVRLVMEAIHIDISGLIFLFSCEHRMLWLLVRS